MCVPLRLGDRRVQRRGMLGGGISYELRPTFWRTAVASRSRPDLRLVSGQVTQWSVRLDLGLVDRSLSGQSDLIWGWWTGHSVVSRT